MKQEIEAKKLIKGGQLITAIRVIRDANLLGLKESKDICEAWRDEMGLTPKPLQMKLAPNPHLSDFLAEHVKIGVIDFRLRASLDSAGSVQFYIHSATGSGRTEDYHLQPGKVEVMNLRGMNALIEAAMKSKPAKRKK